MLDNAFTDFVTLWVTVDPIGTVPLFLSVVNASSPRELRWTATQGVLIAAGVLLGFLVFGQFLLHAMGITIYSFQIAGGLILFKLGLSMIFAEHSAHGAGAGVERGHNPAIFPLAMPLIAGPGAILAVVVLTDNDRFSVLEQTRTAVVLLVVLLAQWILLMAADPIRRRLGMSLIAVLGRVMGMILAALSVATVIAGIKEAIRAWHP